MDLYLEECIDLSRLIIEPVAQMYDYSCLLLKLYLQVIQFVIVIYFCHLIAVSLFTLGKNALRYVPDFSFIASHKQYQLRIEEIQDGINNLVCLHDSNTVCTKNLNHQNFIPMKNFRMADLPKGFQTIDLYNSIVNFSKLVVKIVVSSFSKDRCPGLNLMDYDLDPNDRGMNGSGHFWDISKCRWHESPCPCSTCRAEGTRSQGWGELHVFTANHVVCNNEEAWQTKIYYGYDGNCQYSPEILVGYQVVQSSEKDDTCELVVITHDRVFLDKVKSQIDTCMKTSRAISDLEMVTLLQKGKYLTIIISHPHGFEKQVSIGYSKGRSVVQNDRGSTVGVKYYYDTPTCPGSSGAPVFVVGKERSTLRYPPHVSGNVKRNRNFSGTGQERNEPIGFWTNLKHSAVVFILSRPFSVREKPLLIINVIFVKLKRCVHWIRNILF
ncbi:hypothetical protein BgiBS90_030696 [Biomphalaria glabrata]|nr:hypothetical protein BgiBS90_030696 [Biomphalaria glabrata]